jgi:hypothetical protein
MKSPESGAGVGVKIWRGRSPESELRIVKSTALTLTYIRYLSGPNFDLSPNKKVFHRQTAKMPFLNQFFAYIFKSEA